MRLYKFDKENLNYVPVDRKRMLLILSGASALLVLTFIVGMVTSAANNVVVEVPTSEFDDRFMLVSRYDVSPEDEQVWKDSVFRDYEDKATLWLNRPVYKGTPIKGDMLALCARNAYDSTGILLPVELALSQCQWESGMGREGKSPVKNPYNVGETDSGTVKWFESTFEGVQSYYYYMCNDYLRCKSVEELFVSFTNCNGKRYASSDAYEYHVSGTYYQIKRWLEKNKK